MNKNFTMAKFCAAIIALFCLFTLSLSRTLPENDDATTQVSLPLSESTPALRLPSDPVNTETQSDAAVLTSVPLTKVNFRPINRRFHMRSKRPCRHHLKVYPLMRQNEEIPYGNDMILSSGENSDFDTPVFHGEGRRIPGRWVRLHHHHHHHDDEDSDSDDDEIKKNVFKRYNYDRFEREKKLKVLKKMRKHFRLQNEVEEKKKGGFWRRVRKFLDHHF